MTPPRYALGLLLFFFSVSAPNLCAQTAAAHPPDSIGTVHRAWPEPRAEDVRSVDSTIKSYFDVISGKAETPRDWKRFRSLFLPEGRIVALHTWSNDPHPIPGVYDVERYIQMLKVNLAMADVDERVTKVEVHPAQNVIQVQAVTESRIGKSARVSRFLMTFELIKDVDRYWIVDVTSQKMAGIGNRQ